MSALIALRSYLFRYRVAMIGGFLFLIAANAVALILSYLIRLAVDSLQHEANAGTLLRFGLLIVLVGLVQAILSYYGRFIQARVSRRIEYELRADLFRHFEKLELDYFQHNKIGDLVARAINDLTAVRGLLGPGLSNLMNTTVAFIATIAFMLSIDPRLTLYSASVLPLITVVFIVVARKIERRFKAVQDQFGEVSAQAQENLTGIRTVKAYTQEDYELEAFRAANQEYVQRSISYARYYALLWPAMYFLAGLAAVILLWRGGLDVIEGRITVGQLVQFTGYLAQLTWPMIAFGWVVNLFQQGSASMLRINEVMKYEPKIVGPETLPGKSRERAKDSLEGNVEFRHVSFSYSEREVLHDINIKIPAGSSLAIVGPTGAGKSTLVNLLPRLFDVSTGQVLLDDVDVREIPLALLRRQVGYVPQETFLFSVPLSENLGFGVENLSQERLQEVMQDAQLSKDVEGFPDGSATMIGERRSEERRVGKE